MALHNHDLKRLQHSANSFGYRSPLPNDETMKETIQTFSTTKLTRTFGSGPYRARRGGGRTGDRKWYSAVSLPKRAINYDLAESFMDHSTNPLSSDLYKFHFKYAAKRWPDGRFKYYKEKLDKLDGNIVDVTCTRSFPVVAKRKQNPEIKHDEQNTINPTSSVVSFEPIIQEQKKKLADNQTNLYSNWYGSGKMPPLSSTTQIKKTNCISNSTISSTSDALLGEGKEDHQC